MRELDIMATGRGREVWEHTSAILATLMNVNGGLDGKAVPFDAFNPHSRASQFANERERCIALRDKIRAKRRRSDLTVHP